MHIRRDKGFNMQTVHFHVINKIERTGYILYVLDNVSIEQALKSIAIPYQNIYHIQRYIS